MKDLTKGSPSKVMISFAIPVALGNIFQLCYSLADTRVVGSTLGEAALAAVGATTSALYLSDFCPDLPMVLPFSLPASLVPGIKKA